MDDKPFIEFFYNSTLKGTKFYFYCPNMAQKDKASITNLIKEYDGVRILIYNLIMFLQSISSRLTKNTIIIVETEEVINSSNFLKLIQNYGDIYFNYNNHVEKISHNSKKNKILKIITFKELLLELAAFDNKSINYFIDKGLNKNVNQEANISLIINSNRNKMQLETYDFSYQDEKKNIYFDIPYFHKNVPEGFSVFCTDEEYELVINHVKKKSYKLKQKNKNKEEMITSEPEPTKKNYICQLCLVQFDNYKQHISSDQHIKNINEHKNSFNKLSTTFKRIVDNNYSKKKDNKGKKNILNGSFGIELLSEKIKMKDKSNYNLRNKNFFYYNKYNDNKSSNYHLNCLNNTNIKVIKNEKDIDSPQQQVSSTASCTFKNALTFFEDIYDDNKNKGSIKKNKKRKRNEEKNDFTYEFKKKMKI